MLNHKYFRQALFESIDHVFSFGKFKGCPLSFVLEYKPDYVEWCQITLSYDFFVLTEDCMCQIKKVFPELVFDENFYSKRKRNEERYKIFIDNESEEDEWDSYDYSKDDVEYTSDDDYWESHKEDNLMEDAWYAMTDGQYGDMPYGFDGDFTFLGY